MFTIIRNLVLTLALHFRFFQLLQERRECKHFITENTCHAEHCKVAWYKSLGYKDYMRAANLWQGKLAEVNLAILSLWFVPNFFLLLYKRKIAQQQLIAKYSQTNVKAYLNNQPEVFSYTKLDEVCSAFSRGYAQIVKDDFVNTLYWLAITLALLILPALAIAARLSIPY